MGREFEQLFDEWAKTYDHTVLGGDIEYKEVFLHYDHILDETAKRATGSVLEFGPGTGNLTKRLIAKGHRVIAIEPSKEMRVKAKEKIPSLHILDGDFLHFPNLQVGINSIVSTYAFHHLNDSEKKVALTKYAKMLEPGGKIIFADTMFNSEIEKANMIQWAKNNHYFNLVHDLETEYYTTLPFFEEAFKDLNFDVQFEQMNSFVWLMEAVRKL